MFIVLKMRTYCDTRQFAFLHQSGKNGRPLGSAFWLWLKLSTIFLPLFSISTNNTKTHDFLLSLDADAADSHLPTTDNVMWMQLQPKKYSSLMEMRVRVCTLDAHYAQMRLKGEYFPARIGHGELTL